MVKVSLFKFNHRLSLSLNRWGFYRLFLFLKLDEMKRIYSILQLLQDLYFKNLKIFLEKSFEGDL